MVKLFESYSVKGVTLKNRIVMSPMCMYSSHQEDGKVENWHMTHYGSRAVGGVGLIIQEATAVSPEGRISSMDLGIWNDDQLEGLKRLVSSVKEHGTAIGLQLAHAGRKATVDGTILAPSALPFNEDMKTPKEMSIEEIRQTVVNFKDAANRAKEAGYDVIEIHAAHGYLINEFLSPLTNRREDEYGGNTEKRYRFLKEVIDAVNEVWEGPLFVRVSAHDYHEEGLTPEDYIQYSKWMKEQGVDLLDVSSGAVVPAPIPVFPGYQVPFAEQIKHGADIDTGAVGLITNGYQAEEILQNKRADLIFIGRELLRDPYWPKNAAKELRTEIEPPKQYGRGW
ncbi:NADPH dehydrogenase [Bacillus coahuilensis p1.1.43]|uniref:NADPH dehydrogenase n=1 Tax=Bacillus coahuilensis p1.1.43 TaxID=1150625 RepID=A0A147K856_9BACI|nr:NADPH dehydrogenase NamA [Bacillus coahuilensis]KUP06316.1 NADPH dehydrogenase [Bacillus coahuilensis p1.1.43]